MNVLRQIIASSRWQIPRIALLAMMITGMLFAAQAQPTATPAEMKPGGACAEMHCTQGCCANVACCKLTEQQRTSPPQAPARQAPHFPLEAAPTRLFVLFVFPPAPERWSSVPDTAATAHSPPPLTQTCIQLI